MATFKPSQNNVPGSTESGTTTNDTHSFTGSVNITGSLTLNGSSITGGGGGSPGGSDTQVQFNDGGSFGGDSDMVWNKTTNVLTVNGSVSGSSVLANVLTASGYAFPAAPGEQFQILRVNGTTQLTFDYADRATLECRFDENVIKGDPVYITGFNVGQNRATVAKAEASDAAKMPAVGLAFANYSTNDNGQVTALGNLDDVNSNLFGVGDTVYVSGSGGLTNTKPTGSSLIQNMGQVGRVHASNGQITVFAIGRTNDVPNIDAGKIFVGTATNTTTSSVVTIDEAGSQLTVAGTVSGSTVLGEFVTASYLDVTTAATITQMGANIVYSNVYGGNTQAASGSIQFPASDNNVFDFELQDAVQLTASAPVHGASYVIYFRQDGSGNHTLTFDPDTFKFPGGTPPTVTADPGSVDVLTGIGMPSAAGGGTIVIFADMTKNFG